MQLRIYKTILIPIVAMFAYGPAYSQSQPQSQQPDSSKELEQLLSSENQATAEDEVPEKPQAPLTEQDPKELSDLGRLAPFSDVAVIQKRYLPKTSRFEFFPSLGTILNDVFFFQGVFSGRIGYYFSERYGVEAAGFFVSTTTREVIKDLERRQVLTESFAFPESYYGLDFKWTPVYGKMGFMSKTVVPFDLYFLGGMGITNTNQKTSPSTFHLGTGQIFALSKWTAFRWDLGFYFYSTKSKVAATGSTAEPSSYMNMHLTLGMSFFFPEASYR